MGALRRIRWKWVIAGGFLAEVAILVLFFLLLLAATLAGVPEIAAPMSTLDNIDAIVASFVMAFLFALWVGKRVESDFVLHGALVGLTGAILFTALWVATTPSWLQPWPYVLAHCSKVLGGIAGGIVAGKRAQRRLANAA